MLIFGVYKKYSLAPAVTGLYSVIFQIINFYNCDITKT